MHYEILFIMFELKPPPPPPPKKKKKKKKSRRNPLKFDIFTCLQKLTDVQDFLKVPRRELKSRQVKIHKGSLSQQVENWDDLKKVINGTHYESFLQADYRK